MGKEAKTPEERAELICRRLHHAVDETLHSEIAHAICQAIAATREEDAKLAFGSNHPVHSEWANGYSDGRDAAAEAIRRKARTQESTP